MLTLQRSAPITEIEGRTIYGACLTYERVYMVTDNHGATWYQEAFRVASFSRSIEACRNTFELRRLHDEAQRIGVVSFDDSNADLRYRAILDGTDAGEAALADITAGKLRAVSVGYRPRSTGSQDGVRWRHKADLRELSVTPRGQFPDAQVEGVRSAAGLEVVQSRAAIARALEDIAGALRYVDA